MKPKKNLRKKKLKNATEKVIGKETKNCKNLCGDGIWFKRVRK